MSANLIYIFGTLFMIFIALLSLAIVLYLVGFCFMAVCLVDFVNVYLIRYRVL